MPYRNLKVLQAHWNKFSKLASKRLLEGDEKHKGASFVQEPRELLSEVQEDLLDVAVRCFILWCNLEGMDKSVENITQGGPKKSLSPAAFISKVKTKFFSPYEYSVTYTAGVEDSEEE